MADNTGNIKKRITTRETAEILGISPVRVRRMIMDGIIKDVEKFGSNNAISVEEIEKLKSTRRTAAGRPPKAKAED
jgi:predicted site-specific integrase-resolvase